VPITRLTATRGRTRSKLCRFIFDIQLPVTNITAAKVIADIALAKCETSFILLSALNAALPRWLHGIAALLLSTVARLLDLPQCPHNTGAKAGRDQHEKKGLARECVHKCRIAVAV
jgi:hypothetical protein